MSHGGIRFDARRSILWPFAGSLHTKPYPQEGMCAGCERSSCELRPGGNGTSPTALRPCGAGAGPGTPGPSPGAPGPAPKPTEAGPRSKLSGQAPDLSAQAPRHKQSTKTAVTFTQRDVTAYRLSVQEPMRPGVCAVGYAHIVWRREASPTRPREQELGETDGPSGTQAQSRESWQPLPWTP